MVDPIVPALREAARHRGYQLLVSRKRTPGSGDYGKFGLADAKGKPILGSGPDGLTAAPEEIEAYLRGGELETWKRSARLAPEPLKSRAKKASAPTGDETDDIPPPRKPAKPTGSKASRRAPEATEADPNPSPRSRRKSGKAPQPPTPDPIKPKLRAAPAPLSIRKAKPKDAKAIAKLLAPRGAAGQQAADVASRMAQFAKAGSGLLVAEQGDVIGCLAWTQAPALHRPPSGRIATLFVAERQRRSGVGRALVEEAARILGQAGCESIEAMSDIDIRSAHGFFRRLDFAETSYRFAKTLAKSQ